MFSKIRNVFNKGGSLPELPDYIEPDYYNINYQELAEGDFEAAVAAIMTSLQEFMRLWNQGKTPACELLLLDIAWALQNMPELCTGEVAMAIRELISNYASDPRFKFLVVKDLQVHVTGEV